MRHSSDQRAGHLEEGQESYNSSRREPVTHVQDEKRVRWGLHKNATVTGQLIMSGEARLSAETAHTYPTALSMQAQECVPIILGLPVLERSNVDAFFRRIDYDRTGHVTAAEFLDGWRKYRIAGEDIGLADEHTLRELACCVAYGNEKEDVFLTEQVRCGLMRFFA